MMIIKRGMICFENDSIEVGCYSGVLFASDIFAV